MNTTGLKLTNPTDDELSAAVAEHVLHSTIKPHKATVVEIESGSYFNWEPNFATSADAVLPLLEKMVWFRVETQLCDTWVVSVSTGDLSEDHQHARANTLPRAVCIALLRAHKIEVETSPSPPAATSQ